MKNGTINPLLEFFRCPEWFAREDFAVALSSRLNRHLASAMPSDPILQQAKVTTLTTNGLRRWADLLRYEQYEEASTETTVGAIMAREAYYLVRPLLGVTVRRHFQRLAFRGWEQRRFPRWPVDRTTDELHEVFLRASMERKGAKESPFIWFWPKGYSSCALLTHDVETDEGLRFCPTLMDLDDEAGIKSSFQLVPEQRYQVSQAELDLFRARGFEVNVHDLNHDGHLFRDHKTFKSRVVRINEYGRKFGALGFRAGALYRNQDWYDLMNFEYDMSVPNVAHLDPQRGGCCTVFPYFVGDVLELPVTAIQDYSLFHVLRTYSTDLWRDQMDEIFRHHGMMNVITHPDYLIETRARETYREFLKLLAGTASTKKVWLAKPLDVNQWWRQRSKMQLVWQKDRWSVIGEGSEKAAVVFARTENTGISFTADVSTTTPAAVRLI